MMTLTRFKALCEAYGGDLRRWPATERADAEALSAQSAEARDVLAEAALLDAALSQARSPAPSPELSRRVAESAPGPSGAPSWAAVAAAAALMVGLGAGWLSAGGEQTSEADLYAEAFGALDAPSYDFLEDA
ncbi:MAG: hypothetical protein RKE49_11305 [Oceanicaulis sp.]